MRVPEVVRAAGLTTAEADKEAGDGLRLRLRHLHDSSAASLTREADPEMGLNTENLFVQIEASDDVKAAVGDYLQTPSDVPHADWPLEITFDPSRVARGRRVSISDSRSGWVAVVDSSETVDPNLALFLSRRLSTRVAIAQVYEVTGSCGFAMAENGIAHGGPTRSDLDDPFGAVTGELAKAGIPFGPVLFRDTVGKHAAGWHAVSRVPSA